MIRRWRTLFHPEAVDTLRMPTAGEAAALWFLGSAWLLYSAWLAVMGLQVWLLAVPFAGLLAIWGWKRRGWLFWFPAAAVVAALLDARLEGASAVHLLDLVLAGMALAVIARRMAHGWPRMPWPWLEWCKFGALFLGAALVIGDPRGESPRVLRLAVVGAEAFATAWIAARRAPASVRPQLVFPIVALSLGVATLVAGFLGRPAATTTTVLGVTLLLAAALPFAWALAVRPGRRRQWSFVSALIGTVALGAQVATLLARHATFHPFADPRALTLVGAAVLAGSRPSPGIRVEAGSNGRWRVAVTVGLGTLAAMEGDPRFVPVAVLLVATAAGLGLGWPERMSNVQEHAGGAPCDPS